MPLFNHRVGHPHKVCGQPRTGTMCVQVAQQSVVAFHKCATIETTQRGHERS